MAVALFVDNNRTPPEDGHDWTVARSSLAAIRRLAQRDVTYLSLDYDLDGDDKGWRVVEWLDRKTQEDPTFPFPEWHIHSANPYGAEMMRRGMRAIGGRVHAG